MIELFAFLQGLPSVLLAIRTFETVWNIALINRKCPAENPSSWIEEIYSARAKSSSFEVVEADIALFRNWTNPFKIYYTNRLLKTRTIRKI